MILGVINVVGIGRIEHHKVCLMHNEITVVGKPRFGFVVWHVTLWL